MALSPGRRRALVIGLVFAAIAGIAYVSARPAALPPVTGVVRSTEILIAPELSGRLGRFHANAGDRVRAGDLLADLDNPELVAAVAEAKAALEVAAATRDRVYAGIRQEQVDILAHEIDKRRSNLVRAQQEYQRIAALAANYNTPRQKLDEVSAAAAAAQAELEVAEARHAEAQAGPTAEERATADADVALARASLAVLQRRLTKTELRAPVDGADKIVGGRAGRGDPTWPAGHDAGARAGALFYLQPARGSAPWDRGRHADRPDPAGHGPDGSRQGSARRADLATSPPGARHGPWATTI